MTNVLRMVVIISRMQLDITCLIMSVIRMKKKKGWAFKEFFSREEEKLIFQAVLQRIFVLFF